MYWNARIIERWIEMEWKKMELNDKECVKNEMEGNGMK
jgi:hypothetical protein